ncbi:MAG: hypothetical protein ACR2OR_11765 [Hyphomicrobiales bacterium]
MTVLKSSIAALVICLGFSVATPPAPALAGNIYDSNVENRIRMSSSQRSKVKKIVRQSDREMRKVFKKYGINPNRRPEFAKLQKAARELQAIENREKAQMSKVLNADQYKQYKAILNETAARVRAAAK